MRVVAVREKFDHISSHSGYDTLYSYLSQYVELESIFCNFKKKYKRGIGRLMLSGSKLAGGSSFYNAQSFESEAKLFLRNPFKKIDLVHYSHGEPYFGLGSKYRNRLPSKLVLTNNQPVTWWQTEKSQIEKFGKADAIIALSEYDRDYFGSISKTNVVYIPHGVDIDFYKPTNEKKAKSKFKVLFSGRYLRDIDTLVKLIKRVDLRLDMEFTLLYFEKSKVSHKGMLEIADFPNVNWRSNLTEEEYLDEYQTSDCCLIPLLDSTANNAILEAMACALPIISTDLPSIRSYLKSEYSILAKKENVDELYEALMKLYSDRAFCKEMGLRAREAAEINFDWRFVAERTNNLFNSIL